uniref:Uncharacterized protein n=1 Tax=Ciona intestinalis TaxID=7719 RepID=H2XPI5_CIOIN
MVHEEIHEEWFMRKYMRNVSVRAVILNLLEWFSNKIVNSALNCTVAKKNWTKQIF